MSPKVKVCGIRTIDEINIVNNLPIDFVGFVFAPSKRQIYLQEFHILRNSLRRDIKTVGVFVNERAYKINSILKKYKIDIAQLHGEETNFECSKIQAPVWKSIPVESRSSIDSLSNYTKVNGFLLDTFSPSTKGGTGKTFNWNLVTDLSSSHFIILAGGLNEENILSEIQTVKPNVVDVSSGVERNGKKDKELIEKFIRRVKSYDIK